MPSWEMKKGTILQLFEESLLELGIIKCYRKYPSSRSEQCFGFPMIT
jgi:hypothetical protein